MNHKKPSKIDLLLTKIKLIKIVDIRKLIVSIVILLIAIAVITVISVLVGVLFELALTPTEPIKIEYEPHVVEAGDTLWDLTRELPGKTYNWVKVVEEYNNCTALIKVGEVIYLPVEVK